MASLKLYFLSALFQVAYACPLHGTSSQFPIHHSIPVTRDWNYENSNDWARINPNYTLCQIGTTQSPIRLSRTPGLYTRRNPSFSYNYNSVTKKLTQSPIRISDDPGFSLRRIPSFSFNYNSVAGQLFNWEYGAAFDVDEPEITRRPSLTYDDVTIYLKGWHIHAPAEHTVDNFRSRAELHLVHTDANDEEAGVLGILIDPGQSQSDFFSQIIAPGFSLIPEYNSGERVPVTLNMDFALNEVDRFLESWTYSGSLTSPPCKEGIRWWVARKTLFVDTPQLQELLRAATYSARPEQSIWEHDVSG